MTHINVIFNTSILTGKIWKWGLLDSNLIQVLVLLILLLLLYVQHFTWNLFLSLLLNLIFEQFFCRS